MKTTLSIEESERLIELGVDPKLASRWVKYSERIFDKNPQPNPIFSLTNILSILPKEIMTSETLMGDDFISELQINWDCNRKLWRCAYLVLPHPVEVGIAPELIDALNQLLIWCLTEKKINLNTDKK